jgi:hypothetical protein
MTTTHVYIVHNGDPEDPIFAFEREEDAKRFHVTYGGDATYFGETPIITPDTAAEMIADRLSDGTLPNGERRTYYAESGDGEKLSDETEDREEALDAARRHNARLVEVVYDEDGEEIDSHLVTDFGCSL